MDAPYRERPLVTAFRPSDNTRVYAAAANLIGRRGGTFAAETA